MATWYLQTPLQEEVIQKLRIGDIVYFTGKAFTCRSRLQRWVFDEGNCLPEQLAEFDLLIHAGPIVLEEGTQHRLISFMPTSSLRFEKWGAYSIEKWNLKMIVGKTTMGQKTMDMMVRKGCVHVSPQSVAPNMWIDSINITGVLLKHELGSIEAPWLLKCTKLGPFVVDMDTEGNNLFDVVDEHVVQNKEKAFALLGIDSHFVPTRLYGIKKKV